MNELKLERVWTTVGKFGYDPELVAFEEAAARRSRLWDGRWPVDVGIGLALGSGLLSVQLLDCYDDGKVAQGAAAWLSALDSYAEVCHGGASLQVIGRGALPEGAVLPSRVLVQSTGFVPVTCNRIAARARWYPGADVGTVRDVTEALEHLCVSRAPHYVTM